MSTHFRSIDLGGGILRFEVEGNVDIESAAQLQEELLKAVKPRHFDLMVNLNRVHILDTTGLGVFISVRKALRDAGKNLSLVFSNPHLERIFEITGLNRFFEIFPDEERACHALSRRVKSRN